MKKMCLITSGEQNLYKKALILAAGFGKRMKTLTEQTPKPLLKLNGFRLIDYTLFFLHKIGVTDIAINVHYLAEQVVEYLQGYPYGRVTVFTEPAILGTAGAVKSLYPDFAAEKEEVFLINPDEIFTPENVQIKAIETRFTSHLYLKEPDEITLNEPGWQHSTGNEVVFSEKKGLPIYMGFSIIRPAVAKSIPRNTFAELGPIWKSLSKEAKISGSLFPGDTWSCGNISDFEKLQNHNPLPVSYLGELNSFLEVWKGAGEIRKN